MRYAYCDHKLIGLNGLLWLHFKSPFHKNYLIQPIIRWLIQSFLVCAKVITFSNFNYNWFILIIFKSNQVDIMLMVLLYVKSGTKIVETPLSSKKGVVPLSHEWEKRFYENTVFVNIRVSLIVKLIVDDKRL